ncbi:adenylate/guanylate cyclase domain-containing protein [Ruegeria lacuscaerulensis]|uniref:adenylate/guanylate cyclase domain-containing protein n=1 Tax=Ruegeria lacuscaerulensis TaxID=55218 RepID=UPI00147BA068|nr:tetratricopeptide repeat protein [Ruegeria lacuscaerulensis]
MERRLSAILCSDVVGYSRAMGADETGTLESLKSHRREIIDPKIAQYSGRIIKLMGDGALVEFASVVDAVACAVEMQGALAKHNADLPEERRLLYRVGINLGDIIVEGDDIYGDGVNIAARLQTLADPGGICISRAVHTQVTGKLDLTYENMGPQAFKNIATPVPAYRVILDDRATALVATFSHPVNRPSRRPKIVAALAVVLFFVAGLVIWQVREPSKEPLDATVTTRQLPDKPSIAVLTLDDLSTGEDRGYLSDAIAEGIITNLSHFSELFVIARNSSFFFKDKPTDMREIASDFGVHYILEGSQQKAGDRLRIRVQLIDAESGNHIWADTYDRDLADIFAVQDEIASTVASTVGAKVVVAAGDATKKGNIAQLRAFEYWLKGTRHWYEWTEEGNEKARLLYLKAIETDPTLPRGHLGLAWVHINGYRWGWTELDRNEALTRARQRAQIALGLAPDDYFPHHTMAVVLTQAGEREQAIVEFEKALELNPNAANVIMDLAEALVYAGRTEEAIDWMHRAMRLDPHHADWFYWSLGWAQYSAGDCQEALATMRKISNLPGLAHRTVAATHVCLGQYDEARAAITALLDHVPNYSVAKVKLSLEGKYKKLTDLERFIDDLHKAGLSE